MRFSQSTVSPSFLRYEDLSVCNQPLISEKWRLASVQWALQRSVPMGPSDEVLATHWQCGQCSQPLTKWKMGLAQCAVSPSSLRDGVNTVSSQPLINWEIGSTQCAVSPSSMRYEVWPVFSQHPIPERWGLASLKPATHPREMKFNQCAARTLS